MHGENVCIVFNGDGGNNFINLDARDARYFLGQLLNVFNLPSLAVFFDFWIYAKANAPLDVVDE